MMNSDLPLATRASNEQIRADARRLAASGRLPRLIAETAPLAVLVINSFQQIVYANRTMAELAGAEPDELLGLRPGEALRCEHSRQGPGGCGTSEFCVNCGAARAIVSSLAGRDDVQECRISTRDRDALDLRVWTSAFEEDGRHFGLFMAQDISSEKRRDVLERAFFHDVLNTAGAALSYARLEELLPGEGPRLHARVPQLIRRLIEEIESHRDLKAMELGRFKVDLAPVRADALLRELVSEWGDYGAARGKRLEVVGHREVTLDTDRTLLRRVLDNMIRNALEASQQGDTVVLRCEKADDEVRLSVTNPAVMPRSVQLQVFDRSFSTKGPGRGLGTYSMRLLTEWYLGGSISFSSVEGLGTTFVVRLNPRYDRSSLRT